MSFFEKFTIAAPWIAAVTYCAILSIVAWNVLPDQAFRRLSAERTSSEASLSRLEKNIEGCLQHTPRGQGLLECAADAYRLNRQADFAERELRAQEATALWAFGSAIISFGSLALATLGTAAAIYGAVYVRRAYIETQKATVHSADSAAAAHKAVEAARETNRIAAETLIADQRPWLFIDFALDEIRFDNFSVSVKVTAIVKNLGKSPAIASILGMSFSREFITDALADSRRISKDTLEHVRNVIPPGEPVYHKLEAKADEIAGSTVEFALTVYYRMVGSARIFETTQVIVAYLPDIGFPQKKQGVYTGRIKLSPGLQGALT